MVARTPSKQRKLLASIDPALLRETVKKVDKCMATLQELQSTVAACPSSSRNLRCKQESLKQKNSPLRKGGFPGTTADDWKRMSLPAMLVGETVGEILQASKFAKEAAIEDPKTPLVQRRREKGASPEGSMRSRRKMEKLEKLQSIRSESGHRLQRARSRIIFKVSPSKKGSNEEEEEKSSARGKARYATIKLAKKAVLFPNPLFLPADSTTQQKFYKTRSPVIARKKGEVPHKFLIKSPPQVAKFQVKVRSPPKIPSLSPARGARKKTTEQPQRMGSASKLRRSLSPARIAARFASPLRNVQRNGNGEGFMNSLKLRTVAMTPRRFSLGGKV